MLALTVLVSRRSFLFSSKGKHAEAEPLLRRTLAIDETAYGSDHPRVAVDLDNLAVVLEAQVRAVKPHKPRTFLGCPTDVVRSLRIPCPCHFKLFCQFPLHPQGDSGEAELLFARSANIRETLGPDSDLVASLNDLAESLILQVAAANFPQKLSLQRLILILLNARAAF